MRGRPHHNASYFSLAIAGLALVFVFVLAVAARLGVDEYHDGLIFKSAYDIATGSLLPGAEYSQYGILFDGVNALILWLSGFHFVALKLWTAALYGAGMVLSYAVMSKVSHPIVGASAALVYLLLFPFLGAPMLVWASALALPLTLVLMLLLAHALDGKSRTSAFVAGLVLAGLFFIKVNVGATLAVGLIGASIIVLIGDRGRGQARMFLSTMQRVFVAWLASLIVTFAYLAAIGALGYWVYQNLVLPATMSDYVPEVWYDRPNDLAFMLSRLFPTGVGVVWLAFPVIVVATSVVIIGGALIGRTGPKMRLAIVLAAIAGGSWVQYYPVVDPQHAFWSAMAMLPLLGYVVWQAILALWRRFGGSEAQLVARCASLPAQIATSATIAIIAFIWFAQSWQVLAQQGAPMRPIDVPQFALIEDSITRADDLERLAQAIDAYGGQHGPVRLVNLSMNALFDVLAPNPARWSRVPALYSLYTEKDEEQSLQLADELSRPEQPGDPRLFFSNAYGYFQPALRPLVETSQGGLLLAPGESNQKGDLPQMDDGALKCAEVSVHAALQSPFYTDDPRRFWGYFMPPIRATGPVLIDILAARRTVEGVNSVMVDAHIDESSPTGFSIRRFADRGDDYFLTEWIDGRPEPLIALELSPEVIHHIQLRHENGAWTAFVDGQIAGSVPSKLPTLQSNRAIRLGAGHRYVDSLVGEIVEWRVADLENCKAPAQLPPPSPGIAAYANSDAGRFAAHLSR